jgi:D-alanine-D-alanine ligase
LKVTILYNTFEGYEEYPGADIEAAAVENGKKAKRKRKTDIEAISEALVSLGHEPSRFAVDGRPQTLTSLSRSSADLYFNLVESYAGDDTMEMHFAAFLDLVGKKYTGTGPHGSCLAMDKTVAKKLIKYHDLDTPYSVVMNKGRVELRLNYSFRVYSSHASDES